MQDGAFDKVVPSIFGLVSAVHRIDELTKIDMQHKSKSELLQSAVEELGELARELNIEGRVFGNTYKEAGADGTQMESVDLAICALALYFACGGDAESLGKRINAKLDKWESKQNESVEHYRDELKHPKSQRVIEIQNALKSAGCPVEALDEATVKLLQQGIWIGRCLK